MSDAFTELIKACLRQDRRAQRKLYDQHYSWALNICMRYGRHRSEAEEMVNDGFLRIFRFLHTYRVEAPFRAWANRIIINAALDRLKRKQLQIQPLDQIVPPSVRAEPIESLQYEDVLKVIQALPPAYRAVFNLYEVEGYKHGEIAAMLDISESTSRSNLLRAKRMLRVRLQANRFPLSHLA